MPSKRRPLSHAAVGDIRVTPKMIAIYKAWQDALRAGDVSTYPSELCAQLDTALGHMPWDDQDIHDLHWHQLHLIAFPDPKKRQKRLGAVAWHNKLIDAYEDR